MFAARRPAGEVLEVRHGETGRLLWEQKVVAGDRFTVSFLHSVARSQVDETYVVEAGGRMVLTESVYYSFGAGLPFDLDPGQKFELRDGQLFLTGLNRQIGELWLAVGTIARHQLIVRGEIIPLSSLAKPGDPVVISIKQRSWLSGIIKGGKSWTLNVE
jgi:hypothetical protein